MRKITKQAINAFNANKDFKLNNTDVLVSDEVTVMYLHGNAIARKLISTGQVEISNAGWQSNTTKERLNAFAGVTIVQKNWEWYLNGKKWDGSWTKINNK